MSQYLPGTISVIINIRFLFLFSPRLKREGDMILTTDGRGSKRASERASKEEEEEEDWRTVSEGEGDSM